MADEQDTAVILALLVALEATAGLAVAAHMVLLVWEQAAQELPVKEITAELLDPLQVMPSVMAAVVVQGRLGQRQLAMQQGQRVVRG